MRGSRTRVFYTPAPHVERLEEERHAHRLVEAHAGLAAGKHRAAARTSAASDEPRSGGAPPYVPPPWSPRPPRTSIARTAWLRRSAMYSVDCVSPNAMNIGVSNAAFSPSFESGARRRRGGSSRNVAAGAVEKSRARVLPARRAQTYKTRVSAWYARPVGCFRARSADRS